VTISAPLAAMARTVSWPDLYLPVPTINRERNCRPAIVRASMSTIVREDDQPVCFLLNRGGGIAFFVASTQGESSGSGDSSDTWGRDKSE
jgi:hypothetical protein